MKKHTTILILSCILLVACGATKHNASKEDSGLLRREAPRNNEKLDTKHLAFNTKILHETNNATKTNNNNIYFINFKYPAIEGLSSQGIQNHINNDIKTKVETLTKNYKQDNQVLSSEYSTLITNNLLSIKFIITIDKPTWPPINKPTYTIMTLNYDLNNGKEILLTNLFKPASNYLKIIANAALIDLKEQIKNNGELINISEAMIQAITAPKLENYHNFLFNRKGISIIFAHDKLAPHQANYPKVLILYGKIENLLIPSGPLAYTMNQEIKKTPAPTKIKK